MNEDGCLCQVIGEQLLENAAQGGFLGSIETDAEMFGDIPIRKEIEFPFEQGVVIVGQNAGAAGALDVDQRSIGLLVEFWCRCFVERAEIGGVAKVSEEEKSLCQIFGEDCWRIDASGTEQRPDLEERSTIFMLGRSIHDDAGVAIG